MQSTWLQSLAVVLFAYDEKGNLFRLLRRLDQVLHRDVRLEKVQYAICVQGTDGTLDEAHRFAQEVRDRASVHISHSAHPLGIHGAASEAFAMVCGRPDAYLMMDCDLNHQPEELPRFFEVIERNCVVVGSRFCPGGRIVGMPLWKKCLSTVFNVMASVVLKMPVHDKTSGFRLISAPDLPSIVTQVQGRGFDFYIELLVRLSVAGLKIKEVPICFQVRTQGVSKMKFGRTLADYTALLLRLARIQRDNSAGIGGKS